MDILRKIVMGAVLFLAGSVFADAANLCITFSTKGPDCYADGSVVKDGEWYALVWSPTDENPGELVQIKKAEDEVVLAAPLAKDGHCPYTLFQVDSQALKTTGFYYVCILDTRDAAGRPAVPSVTGEIPASVAVAKANPITATAKAAAGAQVTDVDSVTYVAKWPFDPTTPASITAIVLVGDNVQLSIMGMNPAPEAHYALAGGQNLEDAVEGRVIHALDEAVEKAKSEQENPEDGATLVFERAHGRFFRIIARPAVDPAE